MTEEPHPITVCCYNTPEGCTSTVTFMGIKPVRKICPICQESGIPSERHQSGFSFCRAMRKVKAGTISGYGLGGMVCYEVTCWPKSPMGMGGRVMPIKAGG